MMCVVRAPSPAGGPAPGEHSVSSWGNHLFGPSSLENEDAVLQLDQGHGELHRLP
jgi:hypothetical protein